MNTPITRPTPDSPNDVKAPPEQDDHPVDGERTPKGSDYGDFVPRRGPTIYERPLPTTPTPGSKP